MAGPQVDLIYGWSTYHTPTKPPQKNQALSTIGFP